jgi:hypothetical protein
VKMEVEPAVHPTRSEPFLARGVLSSDHGLSVFLAIAWTYFATMIDHQSRKRTGGFGPLVVGLGIIEGVLAEGPGAGGARPMHPLCPFSRCTQRWKSARMRRAPAAHARDAGCCAPGSRFACSAFVWPSCVASGALVRRSVVTVCDLRAREQRA